jgi:hypothetical protein
VTRPLCSPLPARVPQVTSNQVTLVVPDKEVDPMDWEDPFEARRREKLGALWWLPDEAAPWRGEEGEQWKASILMTIGIGKEIGKEVKGTLIKESEAASGYLQKSLKAEACKAKASLERTLQEEAAAAKGQLAAEARKLRAEALEQVARDKAELRGIAAEGKVELEEARAKLAEAQATKERVEKQAKEGLAKAAAEKAADVVEAGVHRRFDTTLEAASSAMNDAANDYADFDEAGNAVNDRDVADAAKELAESDGRSEGAAKRRGLLESRVAATKKKADEYEKVRKSVESPRTGSPDSPGGSVRISFEDFELLGTKL